MRDISQESADRLMRYARKHRAIRACAIALACWAISSACFVATLGSAILMDWRWAFACVPMAFIVAYSLLHACHYGREAAKF